MPTVLDTAHPTDAAAHAHEFHPQALEHFAHQAGDAARNFGSVAFRQISPLSDGIDAGISALGAHNIPLGKLGTLHGARVGGLGNAMSVLHLADAWKADNGSIGRNVAKTAGGLAGGIVGETAGNTLGKLAGQRMGTAIGTYVGGALGGAAGTFAAGPLGTIEGAELGATAGAVLGGIAGTVIGSFAGGRVGEGVTDTLMSLKKDAPAR